MTDRNTETEIVRLWFLNDEGMYARANELADEAYNKLGLREERILYLADALQEFFTEEYGEGYNALTGAWLDLASRAVERVAWWQIAEPFFDDAAERWAALFFEFLESAK